MVQFASNNVTNVRRLTPAETRGSHRELGLSQRFTPDTIRLVNPGDEIGSTIMKHGGLTDGAGQLKMAADKLEEAWEAARTDWNDVVSRTMQEEQLQPL